MVQEGIKDSPFAILSSTIFFSAEACRKSGEICTLNRRNEYTWKNKLTKQINKRSIQIDMAPNKKSIYLESLIDKTPTPCIFTSSELTHCQQVQNFPLLHRSSHTSQWSCTRTTQRVSMHNHAEKMKALSEIMMLCECICSSMPSRHHIPESHIQVRYEQ